MNSSGMLVGAGPSNRGVRRKSVPSVEARTHACALLYSPYPLLLSNRSSYSPVLTVPISTPYIRVLTVPLTSQCSQDKRRLRGAVVCLCAAAAGRGTASTN